MKNIDDIKLIEKIDSHNMRKLLYDFPCQCEKAVSSARKVVVPSDYKQVKNIVISGMGGSSVGGDLLKNFLRDKIDIPLIVNKSYTLPHWVGAETLFICVSYSGNTEEILSAYRIAKEHQSKIVVISAGGELVKSAKQDNFPIILVEDKTMPPRAAFNYLFFPQIVLLKKLGLFNIDEKEIIKITSALEDLRKGIDINVPKENNPAKKIAADIYGTIPLIYTTSDLLEAVGIRWKTQINENSKNPCYYEFFPELDHNEIMGWEEHDKSAGKFSLILLRDKGEGERMAKRIDITCSLIKDKLEKITEVRSRGELPLVRMFTLLYMGDYVSFYLAMLKGIEPSAVNSISTLKRRIAE